MSHVKVGMTVPTKAVTMIAAGLMAPTVLLLVIWSAVDPPHTIVQVISDRSHAMACSEPDCEEIWHENVI